LLPALQALGASFALFRLPNGESPVLHCSFQSPATLADFEEGKAGFVFAPFESNAAHPAFCIPAQWVVQGREVSAQAFDALFAKIGPEKMAELSAAIDGFRGYVSAYQSQPNSTSSNGQFQATPPLSTRRLDYEGGVQTLLKEVEQGRIIKAVLSRVLTELLPDSISPFALFEAVCLQAPDAFVSLVSIPGQAVWVGATPEVLASQKGNQLHTMSLAGTQASNGMAFGSKEHEEQHVVTQDIRNILKRMGANAIVETEPEAIPVAGGLTHLRTLLTATFTDVPNLIDAAMALHPTPAIGGLPRAAALRFIKENELHTRAYYAGFLGPIQNATEGTLFVNLRCAAIQLDQITYYAGAGLNSGSIAAREWDETEAKMATLRRVVQQLSGQE